MAEDDLWKYVKAGMGNRWRAVRVENKLMVGFPDVVFSMYPVRGFIELKHCNKWPTRGGTLRVDHFTDDQKSFLEIHGDESGYCWALIKIADDFLLYDHFTSREIGNLTKHEMLGITFAKWKGAIDFDSFASAISTQVNIHRRT